MIAKVAAFAVILQLWVAGVACAAGPTSRPEAVAWITLQAAQIEVPRHIAHPDTDCPGFPAGYSCATAAGHVYVSPQTPYPGIWAHELGHVFDRARLTNLARLSFILRVGGGTSWYEAKSDPYDPSPAERFADVYSRCAFPTEWTSYRWVRPSGDKLRSFCRWIVTKSCPRGPRCPTRTSEAPATVAATGARE